MRPIIIVLLFSISCISCENQKNDWSSLLDKDLSQWDKYLSYRHSESYNGDQPKDEQGNLIPAIGANNDQYGVFTIVEENNEKLLRVSGEIYGCIITKKAYENYRLRLKVKWGDTVYPPRLKKGKDSGLLYHSFGEFGADYWRSWMFSHEFQVMRGRTGDYWTIGPTAMDIRAIPDEWIMNYVADENYPFLEIVDSTRGYGYCSRSTNQESKEGEWTTLELICFEDKSLHIVNGKVVMVLQNSSYYKDGERLALKKGKIQIQCEASEVFYKDIEIKGLASLPVEYNKYYE
ncbi:MAG: DUF1080 domain-containing protein [Cyclobacteriaceae bacterium]